MRAITLDQANTIIEGAFARAKELNLKPLSIILLDAGGRIVYAADAVVYETVPQSRARLTWLLKRWYRTGNIEAELFSLRRRRVAWCRPLNVLRGLTRVVVGSALFTANVLVLGFGRKDRIVRPLYTLCRGCGIVASAFGRRFAEYREVHGA